MHCLYILFIYTSFWHLVLGSLISQTNSAPIVDTVPFLSLDHQISILLSSSQVSRYISRYSRPRRNSHHDKYCIFLLGEPYKPFFCNCYWVWGRPKSYCKTRCKMPCKRKGAKACFEVHQALPKKTITSTTVSYWHSKSNRFKWTCFSENLVPSPSVAD